jgi:16S rRNA (cytosine1402-N4)-methyltransferase
MVFHVPVMVDEVVRGLVVDPEGIYLDATVGGGGHSRAILAGLRGRGRLIAVDRDSEAVREAEKCLKAWGGKALVMRGTFASLKELLTRQGVESLHGVLFDLGVSSHQIDQPDRGFSFREDGPLDMRMDPDQGIPASSWIIQNLSEEALAQVIEKYGEERQSRRIARSICRLFEERGMATTADLRRAVELTRPRMVNKTLARVFQALRIAVNDELGQLEEGLNAAIELLLPGGRLAVIAYHSLEDRAVKTKLNELVRGCVCPPKVPVCVCGRRPTFKKVQRRPLRARADEVRRNRRARSAVLRTYEKL